MICNYVATSVVAEASAAVLTACNARVREPDVSGESESVRMMT